MKTRSTDCIPEQGMALLVTVFVLLLVGTIAVAAIHHSGEESTAGGRARATMRNLYAADSGVQLALVRIAQNPPDTTAFSVNLDGGRNVQSRTRADATPQPLALSGIGPPPEGYAITIGAGYVNELYLVSVTSTAPNSTVSELEAKLARLSTSGGSY